MGQDDENVGGPGECPGHEWVPASSPPVERGGAIGFGMLNVCRWCDAEWYEPSNLDKFPDTNGLDPRLYPREVKQLRDLRGW